VRADSAEVAASVSAAGAFRGPFLVAGAWRTNWASAGNVS